LPESKFSAISFPESPFYGTFHSNKETRDLSGVNLKIFAINFLQEDPGIYKKHG